MLLLVRLSCYTMFCTMAVSYTARLEDGTVFEKKGIDGETPLKFVTDEG